MKKIEEDAFCPNCEWTGDATGITSCPVCGKNLSSFGSFNDEELMTGEKEKYPADFLSRIPKTDDEYVE